MSGVLTGVGIQDLSGNGDVIVYGIPNIIVDPADQVVATVSLEENGPTLDILALPGTGTETTYYAGLQVPPNTKHVWVRMFVESPAGGDIVASAARFVILPKQGTDVANPSEFVDCGETVEVGQRVVNYPSQNGNTGQPYRVPVTRGGERA